MNQFTIYQVKEEHIREYGYASMRELLWTHHAEAVEGRELYRIPREAWEPVYTWHTEKDPSLDYIFETFNRNHRELGLSGEATPEDFHGHSMSVSDIVEYPDGRLWFCDSLGGRRSYGRRVADGRVLCDFKAASGICQTKCDPISGRGSRRGSSHDEEIRQGERLHDSRSRRAFYHCGRFARGAGADCRGSGA